MGLFTYATFIIARVEKKEGDRYGHRIKTMEVQEIQAEEKPPSQLPKGISPINLIAQVKNTVPFVFDPDWRLPSHSSHLHYLRSVARSLDDDPHREENFSHVEYFRLCLSAHHATCPSFVPTDVDNHIRLKLWLNTLSLDQRLAMADVVDESYLWDSSPVCTRIVTSPSGEKVSGLQGEWFSTAAAAYGALKRKAPERAEDIRVQILQEIKRETEIYRSLREARQGIEMLKAAGTLAHNLGDLDRVIEMWELPDEDPLRATAFKLGHEESVISDPDLIQAGNLNKALMAIESHRHFPLRQPRPLRRSADLLLPCSPFLDDWGAIIARHPGLAPEEVGEIADALVSGWEKLGGAVGYARALRGIEENFSGGTSRLYQNVPARTARVLKAGELRKLMVIPQTRFEAMWNNAALKFVSH